MWRAGSPPSIEPFDRFPCIIYREVISIGNQELSTETLLAVPIRDDEIFELLERLAATEEMFQQPVSTIRDVAELTEASPNLIARLLGEMRGPGELQQMVGRLDEHDRRLLDVEQKVSRLSNSAPEVKKEPDFVHKPKIVGSTLEKGRTRAPKVQEPPPEAWVQKKQREEIDRYKTQQKQTKEFEKKANKYLAFLLLAIFIIWVLYSQFTTAISPPNMYPVVR